MAVVQISRVQVRRGKANSNAGVPQLASGELGWAVDTQNLYIGNGSISEGAPYVGNTEILTEHTNILSLVGQYIYKDVEDANIQTGPTVNAPVERSLQERLDDTVNIRSFGALGNGIYTLSTDTYSIVTDDTLAIQRAINELFYKNDASVSATNRVELIFAPGIYTITNSIKIPPYAVLKGAGKDKTIIVQKGEFPVFETVGSRETGSDSYVTLADMTPQNQPRFIEVYDMTLRTTVTTDPVLVLDSTVNSTFANVRFAGSWLTNQILTDRSDFGIELRATSEMVTTEKNNFINCDFYKLSRGINGNYDVRENTFDLCRFEVLGEGVSFGRELTGVPGREKGPISNTISNSKFINVDRLGINVVEGLNNLSISNRYVNVGNEGGGSLTATHPVIFFGNGSNVSVNDFFERSMDLVGKPEELLSTSPRYISEVDGYAKSEHRFNLQIPIAGTSPSGRTDLLKLPGQKNSGILVHYFYTSPSKSVSRKGTITVVVNRFTNTVRITDEYDATGNTSNLENLTFYAELRDLPLIDGVLDTIFITYNNSTTDDGYFNYWYEILS